MAHKFNAKLWRRIPKDLSIYYKYDKLKNDYYKVIITDTFEEMYNLADSICGKLERDYNGLCQSMFTIYTAGGKGSRVGYIFLIKDWLGGGTVSHECVHAVTYYFKHFIKHKEKIFTNREYDETFAYMVGSLVYQVYQYAYKNKII